MKKFVMVIALTVMVLAVVSQVMAQTQPQDSDKIMRLTHEYFEIENRAKQQNRAYTEQEQQRLNEINTELLSMVSQEELEQYMRMLELALNMQQQRQQQQTTPQR